MKDLFRQAIGYGAASICALAVDMSLLWMLVRFLGFGYIAAATLSFLAGASVAYILSVRLAFRDHRLNDRRTEFITFVAIGTLGLAVNAGVIAVAINYFGLHYLLAKFVAAGFTFLCNFAARRQILFVRPGYLPVRD